MSPSLPKRSLKRKSNPPHAEGTVQNSQSQLQDDIDLSADSSPQRSFWSPYYELCERISDYSNEVRTAEECVTASRIVDITYVKLAQEIQKIDLSTVNHWDQISALLIRKWDELFSVPGNDGLTFSDIIPINRYRANYFGSKSALTKRKGTDEAKQSQKKVKSTRKKDNSQGKVSKPLEGTASDKPSTLVAHMATVLGAIRENCDHSGAVNYLRLVTDPHSFSYTVYNIFTVSFLIRDNLVNIAKDGEELLVKLVPGSTRSQKKPDHQEKEHFLVDLTTSEWKKLVKVLRIRTGMVTPPERGADDGHFSERFRSSQKMRKKALRPMDEDDE